MSQVVIFDLDETLGYFVEFGIFWEALIIYMKDHEANTPLSPCEFNDLLDLFPEFLRPNIVSVLNYLKHKKESGACNGVMIYTNNQGPAEWAVFIKNYLQYKINYNLFDRIIGAFKINGKCVEPCRTTHDKTYSDFIKCAKLPKNTQICYLDDVYYPKMINDNVYYIKVNPYIHNLSFEEIIKRVMKSKFGEKNITDSVYFEKFMLKIMSAYEYEYIEKMKDEMDIDKIITKKIMLHLQDFFNKKHRRHSKTKNKSSKKSNNNNNGNNGNERNNTKKNNTWKD